MAAHSRRPAARSIASGAVAVALGALSHVLWDGFTHSGDWAVARWDVLSASVSVGSHIVPLHRVLQQGSTLFGALVSALWGLGWWRRQPVASRALGPGQARELASVASGLVAAAVLGAILNGLRAPPTLALRLGSAAVGAMLALGLAVVAWGTISRLLASAPSGAFE